MTAHVFAGGNSLPTAKESLSILVVDDLEDNRTLLSEVFGAEGYQILQAGNGIEALEILSTHTVHLIIADAMMPKMDGFQLCKSLRSKPNRPYIPFVMYTGDYLDDESAAFARSIGVDCFVTKNDGLRRLMNEVGTLIQLHFGRHTDTQGARRTALDEHSFLERHNDVLLRKLEEKMLDLELYTEVLAIRNRELEASEARYRSLFEHAGIGIAVLEKLHGTVNDINNVAETLLGRPRWELLGTHLPLGENLALQVNKCEQGETVFGETQVTRPDNSVIDLEVRAVSVGGQQSDRTIVFLRDVTEEKKLQAKMLQAEKMAMMGRLASGIAHEIRNPLAAIRLNLQFLLQLPETSAAEREALEGALEGVVQVQQVIEKTLGLARPTPPRLQPTQPNEIVQRALWFARVPLQHRNVHTRLNLAPDLPHICVDEKQIEQVLLNILQNAMDASPDDGIIEVSTHLENGSHEEKESAKVVIRIQDQGTGIPAEQMAQLFQPFVTSKIAGTGLGLALSKQIMDRHGATLFIQNAADRGTIAQLIFPASSSTEGGSDVQRHHSCRR